MRKKQIAVAIETIDALDFMKDSMHQYGRMTIEDRAIPDYRDGLKPVHRRVLWAMYVAKVYDYTKTARVVGDVIGKYHPHGDTAASDAIATLVNATAPTVIGKGSWGTLSDPTPAAMRYTECKLSPYGASMLQDTYLSVTEMISNYDGKDREPLILPSLLPNVLLNGSFGIAVGVRVNIPAFEAEGVKKLLAGMYAGKVLTVGACRKFLKPSHVYGGSVDLAGHEEDFTNLCQDGYGALRWTADYEVNVKTREMFITGLPPQTKPETVLRKVKAFAFVASATDMTDKKTTTPIRLRITFKRTADMKNDVATIVTKCLQTRISYNIAVIERSRENDEAIGSFRATGIIGLLERWVEWRTALEVAHLQHLIQVAQTGIDRTNLLMLAQAERKLIASSWEVDDQEAFLAKKLDLEPDQVKSVLSLSLRQLGKLDRQELEAKLKLQVANRKKLESWLKNPRDKMLSDLTGR